jgi:type IV secretion system protein TrbI
VAEQPGTVGAPISDHRPVPRGVLPRGFQTWLMAGLALGIVLIILIAGKPEPPKAPAQAVGSTPTSPSPERLRDYQERLRAMESRQALEAQASPPAVAPQPPLADAPAPAPEDPIAADRKRREYESLFASNVVLSRRPETERPDSGVSVGAPARSTGQQAGSEVPSLQDVADAVVRATGRQSVASPPPAGTSANAAQGPSTVSAKTTGQQERTPEHTDAINAAGPLHPLLEGTIIDTVLTNRLDGSGSSPVNCLVTNPVYSHSGQHVLIPAGARILGETRPVQALGETRLAVAFHRILMPDGSTQRLDQFMGLNQIGDAGLRDQVNQHYWSTFGAAAAVGLISGFAQWLGTAGFANGSGDRTVIIAGAADAASQASLQVMSRFLNRLPTITIREGHRVKVYLTNDLQLPEYQGSRDRVVAERGGTRQ